MNNTNFLTESLPAAQARGTIEPPQSPPEQRPHAKPIVYACSGCSDAGELADRIARQLTRAGVAEMSCLAGIGGRVKSIVGRGEKAERILVIDGCPLNCARKTLELAGFKKFDHLGLHEIGLRKGNCPVTEEHIAAGVEAAARLVAGPIFSV
jgi:uncharacterized metal-binding protein